MDVVLTKDQERTSLDTGPVNLRACPFFCFQLWQMSFLYHSELLFLQRTEALNSQDICRQYKKRFWGCEGEGQKQKSVYLAPKYSPVNSANIFSLLHAILSIFRGCKEPAVASPFYYVLWWGICFSSPEQISAVKWPRPLTWVLGIKIEFSAEALNLSLTWRSSAQLCLAVNQASNNQRGHIARLLFHIGHRLISYFIQQDPAAGKRQVSTSYIQNRGCF